jgi:carotenoid cleavage dioxygenase-like enzyme
MSMKVRKLPPITVTLRPNEHPYLNGAWTPLHEEVDASDLEVLEGSIPADLEGIYLRNTENQIHQPLGRYHPFDGDGMIHQIAFRSGSASYRNRFVRSRCFLAEQEAGRALWGGLMDPPGISLRPGFGAHGALKDSASTDVIVHAGVALATFYQCGEAYGLDPGTLEQSGAAGWAPAEGVSAHPKVDAGTGELLFFNYSTRPPYMHYGVVDANRRLLHYTPVPLPGPRLPHDLVITEHYSILNDFPMFWDETLLKSNVHAVRLHRDLPSRFAVIPRYGGTSDIRWFEAAPTYVLHFLNAYENGTEIIVDGYFEENPEPDPLPHFAAGYQQMAAYVDLHSFRPKLHRWRFDLRSGRTREERLDDRILEFGTVDQRRLGQRNRYAYSTLSEPGWFLFKGFVKHDLETGRSWTIELGPGRYGSEAPFAPRIGARTEDDGYLVSFVTDERTRSSECIVIDARHLEDGPVCRIALPHKISSGTHACWTSAA